MSDIDPLPTLLAREEDIAPIRYRRPFDIFSLLLGLIITTAVGWYGWTEGGIGPMGPKLAPTSSNGTQLAVTHQIPSPFADSLEYVSV